MTMSVLGIDLGTTYSCVGTFRNDRVEIIANDLGNRITPSCVAFTEDERLIGEPAKSQIRRNAENTVYDAKRLIGRSFDDQCVQSDINRWSFKVYDENKKPKIRVKYKNEEKTFFPEQISAMVLGKLKETATNYLRKEVSQAVITVPAYFNDSQRKATRDACAIAGLDVLRIINEPTAAAMAYGFDNENNAERNVLIYDLGGGTFDVSILKVNNGLLEVRSTAGNTHLGGEDFNNLIVDFLIKEFKNEHKIDLSNTPNNKRAIRRLYDASEHAKKILSSRIQTPIEVDYIYEDYDLHTQLTRAKFEELCKDIFDETKNIVIDALHQARLTAGDIEEVILVGGSTRIPKIQEIVASMFDESKMNKSVNPDEAVAYGATIQAAILSGSKSKKVADVMLFDVNPLSLGIETRGEIMSTIIPRNTRIPKKTTKKYSTANDNQTSILLKVLEGERKMAKDNNVLDEFVLTGIPKARRTTQLLDVTFDIDSDGILNVCAKSTSTGKKEEITINYKKGSMSMEDIARMISEARKYKEDDVAQKERVEARNALESYIYNIQHALEDIDSTEEIMNNKHIAETKCKEVLDWITENKTAHKNEYEYQHLELKNVCDSQLRQCRGTSGTFGSLSGQTSRSTQADESKDNGSNIEEVD